MIDISPFLYICNIILFIISSFIPLNGKLPEYDIAIALLGIYMLSKYSERWMLLYKLIKN